MPKPIAAGALLALVLGGCAGTMPDGNMLRASGHIDPALQRDAICQLSLDGAQQRRVEGRFAVDYVVGPGERPHLVRIECRSADGRLLASQQGHGQAGTEMDFGSIAMSCPDDADESAQAAVLAAIERDMQQRSGPKVTLLEIYGVLLDADWALAEVAFDRLGPTLFALQRENGTYRVRSHFSTAQPQRALTPTAQRRLAEGAPGLPARLLGCYPLAQPL